MNDLSLLANLAEIIGVIIVIGGLLFAMLIGTTMENIGVMTFQRIVPFMVVNNLVGSSTVILWRKLEPWISTLRAEMGEPYAFEWFQWLAERLDYEDHTGDPRPAYEAHRKWKPARLTREL